MAGRDSPARKKQRSVVQSAERPSDMRKVNGANPFTSTWDTDSRSVHALHWGPYNTRLIIVPKCVLKNVTLTAIFLNSLVEYQSFTLKERFESVG